MGFLDEILGSAVGIITGQDPRVTTTVSPSGVPSTSVSGVSPSLNPIQAVVGAPLGLLGSTLGIGSEQLNPLLAIAAPIVGGLLGGPAGAAAGQAIGGVISSTGFAGGNGKVATRTIVQTMDLMTGKIIRQREMPGSPFMMNSEVRAAKKVFRQSRNLNNKLPRRTVKESASTRLKNACIEDAIHHRGHGKDC